MIIRKEKIKEIVGFVYCLTISAAIVATIGVVVCSAFESARLTKENNELLKTLVNQDPVQKVHCIIKMEDSVKEEEIPKEIVTEEKAETEEEEKAETEEVEREEPIVTQTTGKFIGQNVELPNLPTDRKVCTDYRVYNIPGTPHNRMQLAAHTDEQGCRRYGEFYIVGLGSAYANRVGETFEVELDTGVIFTIITGDMKPDDVTDITHRFEGCYNYDGAYCANILEFIIDKETFDTRAYQWGGVDWYENFKGNIVRMTYLGRDTSADWDIYT